MHGGDRKMMQVDNVVSITMRRLASHDELGIGIATGLIPISASNTMFRGSASIAVTVGIRASESILCSMRGAIYRKRTLHAPNEGNYSQCSPCSP
jgi:hypothetical protein